MTGNPGENLIFGRYSREDCGLPPAGAKPWDNGFGAARVCMLLLVLAALGWLAGTGMARWREARLALLPGQAAAARAEEIPDVMRRGRMYATALPENDRMRRSLAYACLAAAEKSPRRLGYYANAANLLRGMDRAAGQTAEETFAGELTAGGAFAEIGQYREAFAALERAEAALEDIQDEQKRRSFRLVLVNTQAYFLASAGKDGGGDAQQALHLATLMISSRDELPGGGFASDSAAFLDTLATAWAENGDFARAASTQCLALGLADSLGLDVYLRHYDEFSKGNRNGK